jgi:hypothetical protein
MNMATSFRAWRGTALILPLLASFQTIQAQQIAAPSAPLAPPGLPFPIVSPSMAGGGEERKNQSGPDLLPPLKLPSVDGSTDSQTLPTSNRQRDRAEAGDGSVGFSSPILEQTSSDGEAMYSLARRERSAPSGQDFGVQSNQNNLIVAQPKPTQPPTEGAAKDSAQGFANWLWGLVWWKKLAFGCAIAAAFGIVSANRWARPWRSQR